LYAWRLALRLRAGEIGDGALEDLRVRLAIIGLLRNPCDTSWCHSSERLPGQVGEDGTSVTVPVVVPPKVPHKVPVTCNDPVLGDSLIVKSIDDAVPPSHRFSCVGVMVPETVPDRVGPPGAWADEVPENVYALPLVGWAHPSTWNDPMLGPPFGLVTVPSEVAVKNPHPKLELQVPENG
jgi:hypothetical protein